MQYQTEILRFKEGARSRPPSPEATVAAAQPNALLDAGDQIAVVVDLMPQLPYRSREIRSLVAKTYWTSSGSIVARLRRALGAANRHLVSFNRKAVSGNKCAGSITCAVFSEEELFLGQIGAAYTYVHHPPTTSLTSDADPIFEIFPKRDRILIPLGGTVPPVINIGYTVMQPGTVACLATTRVAESLARENWQEILALSKLSLIDNELSQTLAARKISGSVVLFRAQASPAASATRSKRMSHSKQRQQQDRQAAGQVAASLSPIPKPQKATTSQPPIPGTEDNAPRPTTAPPPRADHPATTLHGTSVEHGAGLDRGRDAAAAPEIPTDSPPQRPTQPAIQISPPPIGEWVSTTRERIRQWRERRQSRTIDRVTSAEHARFHQALRTLLPGQADRKRPKAPKTPPSERGAFMGGLALGFLIIVLLISITMYYQYGGASRADELIERAQTLREEAYMSQAPQDWRQLLDMAEKIVRLDPQNTEAQALLSEAQQAVNTLESAAILSMTPLLDLGTAPQPRRLLVAGGWVYILNTATDAVIALPLNTDGVSAAATTPTTILRRGQTYLGEVVNHLVDLAWITPRGHYPDGAVFIYSEGGAIFVYEPTLGPGSITVQHVQGELAAGNITLMETFGERFYLVNRQINQILMYEPVNGIYESPRAYFAEGVAPDLQLTLDIAIDGRVYLLMGDGTIQTYFAGSHDHSFEISGLPDANFKPLVMDVELDSADAEGLVYLAETQQERIIALDKRGGFVRQYKLPKGELRRIESLTVDSAAGALYLIAENRLFAAPLPNFGASNTP